MSKTTPGDDTARSDAMADGKARDATTARRDAQTTGERTPQDATGDTGKPQGTAGGRDADEKSRDAHDVPSAPDADGTRADRHAASDAHADEPHHAGTDGGAGHGDARSDSGTVREAGKTDGTKAGAGAKPDAKPDTRDAGRTEAQGARDAGRAEDRDASATVTERAHDAGRDDDAATASHHHGPKRITVTPPAHGTPHAGRHDGDEHADGTTPGERVADADSAHAGRTDSADASAGTAETRVAAPVTGDDEPTRQMRRPADGTVPDFLDRRRAEQSRHDQVAAAYGMSGAVPPLPPVMPPYGAPNGDAGRGRGRVRKCGRAKVVVLAIVAAVVVALGVAYGMGVSKYETHLFPNTEIGGIDVGGMTADEADRAIDTSDWHLTIDDVTGDTVTIGMDDAGMTVSNASPADMIAAQDAFAWPFHVFGGDSQSSDRSVSFDYDRLEQTLSSLDMCDASKRTPATDASFRYDQGTSKWYVTSDAQGDVVDKDKLVAAVEGAIDGLSMPTVKVTQDMCVQPTVTSSDESLNAAVDDANKWASTSITYDIDDQQSAVTVDSSVIIPWISISRNDDGTFSATLDEGAVKSYLAKIGDKYDTEGEPLTITTPTGKVASVAGTASDTGWLTDEATELTKLVDDIKNGRTDHREFSMKHRANATKGSDVWGTTYIEVDLSTQHLWYVKDGQVAEDFGIISGKSGYDTPQGVTAVYKKVTNVTLVSPWKDPQTGEPTYKTPIDVGLVISRDGNILIHSAPWQPSSMFGNASYHISGGSHGCVNAPTDKTWDLYNSVPLNTPVVVHS